MKQRIGFVGCYSHDIILMLTRALGYMGKKVLLRDRNEQHTLSVSVPIPEGMSAARTVLEYDGFLFTEQEVCENQEEFEIEMIDFGMEGAAKEIEHCSHLILTTDMLPHHVRRIRKIMIPREKVIACIIRDSVENLWKGEQEGRDFLRLFPNKIEYFLPPDYRDVRNRYVCETLHEYNINKASPEMQGVLYRLVGMICSDCTEKEIRRNIKHRERRRYR